VSDTLPPRDSARRPAFVTTHWSVVLSARDAASPQSADALEKLCRVYWYPLYAYARWRGQGAEDAEDLTQEFFARLLQKRYLDAVERERGRFRTFLLVAFKRFLADEWDRVRSQKRGGGGVPVCFDTDLAERLYRNEPAPKMPADKMFEQRWAMTLLEQTMNRLRAEFESAGKAAEFNHLKKFLAVSKGEIPHAAVAAELGVSEGALRVTVHRLRKRFRQIFREQIAETVARAEDVDEELRHLVAVLGE
jgi:RNA polymerase sigma-70 factor (ECF subfamily)